MRKGEKTVMTWTP